MTYLQLAQAQYENKELAGNYNVGPDDTDCCTTGELVTLFCDKWNEANGTNIIWKNVYDGDHTKRTFLKLDCSKLKKTHQWKPCWSVETAMEKIVEWTKVYFEGGNVSECMDRQITEFLESI